MVEFYMLRVLFKVGDTISFSLSLSCRFTMTYHAIFSDPKTSRANELKKRGKEGCQKKEVDEMQPNAMEPRRNTPDKIIHHYHHHHHLGILGRPRRAIMFANAASNNMQIL